MTDPYFPANPGDLIRSEHWNEMQVKIQEDIGAVRTEVEEARGAHSSLGERFESNPGPAGEPGSKGDTGPAPAHEWDGTQLRFQDPDGNWGDSVDLRGEQGPPGVPLHFLMDCLEKKIQVYVALHLSCASSFPDIGFDGLLPVAEAAQQSSVDRCFDEPEDFVEAVRSLVSIESALLGDEGPLQFLVQEGVIQDGKLDGYKGAVDELQAAIDDLDDHPIDLGGTQEVARLANVVSMHAALLAPLAPAAHSYGVGLSKSLDEQDVRVIDGIGPYYAWKLKAANVKTVSQLSELAPSKKVSGVPSEKLTWFRHQADVITGVKIDAEVFAPLLNFTVSEVLSKGWSDLQAFFEEDEHRAQAKPMFAQLIEDLRTLPGALDDTFLGYCRLRDLGAVTQDD